MRANSVVGELLIDGTWVDVSTDLRARDIVITREPGRDAPRPRTCEFTLDNRDGDYSNRNPNSPYFGLLTRNTQARVYFGTKHPGSGGGSSTASTSHVAPSLTTTGGLLACMWLAGGENLSSDDYTVPVSMTALTERDGTYTTSRAAYEAVGSGATGTRTATFSRSEEYASVSLVLQGSGLSVTDTGTGVSTTMDDITITTNTVKGRWLIALQGWASGNPAAMPDAPYGDEDGWILAADSGIIQGAVDLGTQDIYIHVRAWVKRVRRDGTQTVIFPGVAEAPTTITDNHAALITVSGTITDWDVRFNGEVASWPVAWDPTGRDVQSHISAAGPLRRLVQNTTRLQSALRRLMPRVGSLYNTAFISDPIAYWPLEDESSATFAASALPGGTPMTPKDGTVAFASSTAIPGSAPLPDMAADTGQLTLGLVSTTETQWSVGCVLARDDDTLWFPLKIYMAAGGTYTSLFVNLSTTISVTGIRSSDGISETVITGGSFTADGTPRQVSIQSRATGNYRLYVDGELLDSALGFTLAPVNEVAIEATTDGTATIGHVYVVEGFVNPDFFTNSAVDGYEGETAARRIERLCHEERVAVHIVGDPDESAAMGVQPQGKLADLLQECRNADLGILDEARTANAVRYVCGRALSNQDPVFTADYDLSHLSLLLAADDDRDIVNDYTATRPEGSFATAVLESGPNSVQDPPDGITRYEGSDEYNVETDQQLADVASWQVHVSTWDETWYEAVGVNLDRTTYTSNTTLDRAARSVNLGDTVQVDNIPSFLPPGPVEALVEGLQERISVESGWTIGWITRPAGPWRVFEISDTTADANEYIGRLAGDEMCALSTAIDENDTVGVSFDPNRTRWTTTADDFDPDIPILIGGELCGVSSINTTAATFVAASGIQSADNAAVTPSLYAGHTTRDWILVLARMHGSAGTLATPTDYEVVYQVNNLYLFGKIHDGSESNPTVTPSGGAAGDVVAAITFGLRNMPITLDAMADAIVVFSEKSNSSAQDIAYGGVYPFYQEGCVVLLIAGKSDNWTSVAVPTGLTEITEVSTTTGNDEGLYAAYQIQTTPACVPEGSLVVTGGAAAVSESFVIALAGGWQVMTITRSQNGVVKSHAFGTRIELADAKVLGL